MMFPVSTLILAGALLVTPAMAQSTTQHDHAAHAIPAKKPSVPAQRWATDAPLRDGMARIRQAVTMLEHMEMGHVDPAQAPAFAGQIQSAVNDMIASCKLKPDADAALHGLLVKFIAGANAARAGKFTKAELTPMQDALAQYPQLFDDEDWGKDGG